MIIEIPIEGSPVRELAKMITEMGDIELRDAHNFVAGLICALGKNAFDAHGDGDAIRIVPSKMITALIEKTFASVN